jgi:type I restriction enzyme S subunit
VVVKSSDRVIEDYLYWLFLSPPFNRDLFLSASGTKILHTAPARIEAVRVRLPSPIEQRAIAHILGTLDDKIELNRRMNETLEAMARALFKSWFVDFDPVRAKAEGRDPGLPQPLADLFPDSFEDSELGESPAEWEVRGIDEIAHFLNGLALQKYPPGDGATLPVIKIAQLRKGDTDGADRCNTSVPSEYVINNGDVLFSWSGSLECVLWAGDRGALNQHLFKVTSTLFHKWFYYLWVHEHLASFRHTAAGKATTMGHIQRHHLSDAKIVVPESDVLNAADKVIAPIIEQVMQRRVESRTLAALRDALLPKLISGELRVKGKPGPEKNPPANLANSRRPN